MKILTIGEILYTQDKRFSPIHNEGSNVWILKLTDPQLKDSGEYECQVSYHDDKEERLKMPFSLVVLGKLQLLFEIISLVKREPYNMKHLEKTSTLQRLNRSHMKRHFSNVFMK